MAKATKYYWKKDNTGPTYLDDETGVVSFEQVGEGWGYAVVDSEANDSLTKMLGTGGLIVGSKADYDELKKKPPSPQSPPPWREEFNPETLSSSPTQSQRPAAAAVADSEPGSEESVDKTPVEKQARQAKLPKDDKPVSGKRKKSSKD